MRPSYDPATSIPSLEGKVILITGGNIGLGKAAALALSIHNPAQLWITARNPTTGAAAVTEIRAAAPKTVSVNLLELDLTSFASIKAAAQKFTAQVVRLDILMLNAGIMGGEAAVTKDGYERQFGTNHVGHALLLKLLTPLLVNASAHPTGVEPRVVFVSSAAHKYTVPPGGIDLSTMHTPQSQYSGIQKYDQSKLANALYPIALTTKFKQFTTVSVHPGAVGTGLFTTGAKGGGWMVKLLARLEPWISVSAEEGAKNQLWASTAEGVEGGRYYEPVGLSGKEGKYLKDEALIKRLWDWTEKELQGHSI
ncbi:NAD(P)-binding protein [Melanomma pulvis-pyrius CBS 109.77]|uniref:NAD(P)-binding protein n=1 Tax=Melanomma pulvis-pyrius CBS 109.77 TaxID=1314802 RepID=A0A6A6X1H7_9PLEO|nr:NAD(P)-binding protein [Melanomma pulvis-pyrius CBS 109.77]